MPDSLKTSTITTLPPEKLRPSGLSNNSPIVLTSVSWNCLITLLNFVGLLGVCQSTAKAKMDFQEYKPRYIFHTGKILDYRWKDFSTRFYSCLVFCQLRSQGFYDPVLVLFWNFTSCVSSCLSVPPVCFSLPVFSRSFIYLAVSLLSPPVSHPSLVLSVRYVCLHVTPSQSVILCLCLSSSAHVVHVTPPSFLVLPSSPVSASLQLDTLICTLCSS